MKKGECSVRGSGRWLSRTVLLAAVVVAGACSADGGGTEVSTARPSTSTSTSTTVVFSPAPAGATETSSVEPQQASTTLVPPVVPGAAAVAKPKTPAPPKGTGPTTLAPGSTTPTPSAAPAPTPQSGGSPSPSVPVAEVPVAAVPVAPGLAKARASGIILGFSGGAPFSILQPDGTFSGAGPELARGVLTAMGVSKFEGLRIDFSGLIPALLAGRIDMIVSATNITPARCEQVSFADPFLVTLNSFATRAGSSVVVSRFEDIATQGLSLGVIAGAVDAAQAAKAGVPQDKITAFPDVTSALSGLRDKRVDAVIASIIMLRYTARQTDSLDAIEFSPAFTPVVDGKPAVAAAGMVFRKDDQDFARSFSEVQATLMSTREALRIMAPFDVTPESVDEASKLRAEQLCAGG